MNVGNDDDSQKMPNIVGVTGRKYNGKDTLGNYLVSQHGYKRLAFADALKDACRCVFGFDDEQLYGGKKEEIDEFWRTSPRIALQYIGTELFRNQLNQIMPHVEHNIWVEVIRRKIIKERQINPDTKFVITDVRFPNEINMVRDFEGVLVRVKRDLCQNATDVHASEIEIDNLDVDHEVDNNGTKDEMCARAIDILSQGRM